MAKNCYSDWNKEDHKRGFKLVTDTYQETKCSEDGFERKSFTSVKYQPKGYWSEVLTVYIGGDGSFNFSMSSGGINGDVDGLELMKNLEACFEDAREKRDRYSETLKAPTFKTWKEGAKESKSYRESDSYLNHKLKRKSA